MHNLTGLGALLKRNMHLLQNSKIVLPIPKLSIGTLSPIHAIPDSEFFIPLLKYYPE